MFQRNIIVLEKSDISEYKYDKKHQSWKKLISKEEKIRKIEENQREIEVFIRSIGMFQD